MSLSVYVAGSSGEIPRAVAVTAKLRAAGVSVVSTWPEVVTATGDANPRDAEYGARHDYATTDLSEIRIAHVTLLLCPEHEAARGAYYEAGFTDALDKLLVCSGDTRQSVFTARGIECATDDEAIDLIVAIGKARNLIDPLPLDLGLRNALTGAR